MPYITLHTGVMKESTVTPFLMHSARRCLFLMQMDTSLGSWLSAWCRRFSLFGTMGFRGSSLCLF